MHISSVLTEKHKREVAQSNFQKQTLRKTDGLASDSLQSFYQCVSLNHKKIYVYLLVTMNWKDLE